MDQVVLNGHSLDLGHLLHSFHPTLQVFLVLLISLMVAPAGFWVSILAEYLCCAYLTHNSVLLTVLYACLWTYLTTYNHLCLSYLCTIISANEIVLK